MNNKMQFLEIQSDEINEVFEAIRDYGEACDISAIKMAFILEAISKKMMEDNGVKLARVVEVPCGDSQGGGQVYDS